jgi:hypothetical protein
MICPDVSAWVKQPDDFGGFWIAASDVWPFAAVAVHTRQRQVRQMSLAAVLPRQDMVHMEEAGILCRGHVTVLAAIVSASPYAAGQDIIHECACPRDLPGERGEPQNA